MVGGIERTCYLRRARQVDLAVFLLIFSPHAPDVVFAFPLHEESPLLSDRNTPCVM